MGARIGGAREWGALLLVVLRCDGVVEVLTGEHVAWACPGEPRVTHTDTPTVSHPCTPCAAA